MLSLFQEQAAKMLSIFQEQAAKMLSLFQEQAKLSRFHSLSCS
jgi:hypothetical protein